MPLPSKPMAEFAESDIVRFWAKVDQRGEGDCWNWLASKKPNGYGKFMHKRRVLVSNRVAYCLHTGTDPFSAGSDLLVCHTCNNSSCCNPSHLILGTHKENQKYKLTRGRQSHLHGENQPVSKLNNASVLKIRNSKKSTVALAAIYGVSQVTISKAQLGETWRRVGGKIRPRFSCGRKGTGANLGV